MTRKLLSTNCVSIFFLNDVIFAALCSNGQLFNESMAKGFNEFWFIYVHILGQPPKPNWSLSEQWQAMKNSSETSKSPCPAV